MSELPDLFTWASEVLAARTSMSLPQCRGTLRLALKQVGLVPEQLSRAGLEVLFDQILPRELRMRGIDDPEAICREMVAQLEAADFEEGDGPNLSNTDSVLGRIFG